MPGPSKPSEAEPFGTRRRRSSRLALSIPINLKGRDADGNSFEEKTRTLVVNKHGARLTTVHKLALGAEIMIENPAVRSSGNARIVWVGDKQSPRDPYEVGADLLEPQNLWGIEFPPEDWREGAPTGAGGRRLDKTPPLAGVRADEPPGVIPAVPKPTGAGTPPRPGIDPPSVPVQAEAVKNKPTAAKPVLRAQETPPPETKPEPVDVELPGLTRTPLGDTESKLKSFEDRLSRLAEQIERQTQMSLEESARRLENKTGASIDQKLGRLVQALQSTQSQIDSLVADFERVRESQRSKIENARQDLLEAGTQSLAGAVDSALEEFRTKVAGVAESEHARTQKALQKFQEKAVKEASEKLRRTMDELRDSLGEQLEKHGEDTLELLCAELKVEGKKLSDETLRQLRVTTRSSLDTLNQGTQEARDSLKKLTEEGAISARNLVEETDRQLRALAFATLDSLKGDAQSADEEFRREIERICALASDQARDQVLAAARASLQRMAKDLTESSAAQLRRQIEESLEQAGRQLQEKQQQALFEAEELFRRAIAEILQAVSRRGGRPSARAEREPSEAPEGKKSP